MFEQNQIRYAGFWVRVGASLIDFFVLLIPAVLHIFNLYYWKIFVLEFVIFIPLTLYKPLMEMKYGATVGKMVLDLKVVTLQNRLMNLQETLIRSAPWLFSGLVSAYVIVRLFTHPEFQETTGFQELAELQNSVTPMALNYLSVLFLFISIIVVAFQPEKRGLHDMMAGTICIYDNKQGGE